MNLVLGSARESLPIGSAVLVSGLLFRAVRPRLGAAVRRAASALGLGPLLFLAVLGAGLLSGLVTAVISSLLVVELVSVLRLPRAAEIRIVVYACFAIGLGAALTPLGEPLSTIVVAALEGPPHEADFFFLMRLLGRWLLPGIVLCAALAAAQAGKEGPASASLAQDFPESYSGIAVRALKVSGFVTLLVILSAVLSRFVDRWLVGTPRAALYWLNIVSALLDNATLAAAEVSPKMSAGDLRFVLLGLLYAGGMLVPGNVPNLVCAGKLGITQREWAKVGVPFGAALMLACFVALQLAG